VDDEGYVPDYLTQDRIQGRFQQRYEHMLKRREMAGIYQTTTDGWDSQQSLSVGHLSLFFFNFKKEQ